MLPYLYTLLKAGLKSSFPGMFKTTIPNLKELIRSLISPKIFCLPSVNYGHLPIITVGVPAAYILKELYIMSILGYFTYVG